MAFVRWRGNGAQLLATATDQGRPRHLLLANLHGAYRTTPSLGPMRYPEVSGGCKISHIAVKSWRRR